jgi:hypothetical protein
MIKLHPIDTGRLPKGAGSEEKIERARKRARYYVQYAAEHGIPGRWIGSGLACLDLRRGREVDEEDVVGLLGFETRYDEEGDCHAVRRLAQQVFQFGSGEQAFNRAQRGTYLATRPRRR